MSRSIVFRFVGALSLLFGASAPTFALTLPELQHLLQGSQRDIVAFTETRESPWLAVPAQARGTLHSTPGVLEKRVESPRAEVWRMLTDRVEYVAAGNGESKRILFSQSPAVAVLADTLRRVVAGELLALERNFQIETRGDRNAWSAHLTPSSGEAVRYLDHLTVEGEGGQIRVITVVERKGERTTTRLHPR